MSDGANLNPAPPEHHAAKRKRLADEYQTVLDAAGVATMDELLAKIAAKPVLPDTPVYEVPSDIAAVVDPLSAITPETDIVYLCSEHSSFVMIGEKKGWNPPVKQVNLQSSSRAGWRTCPFESATGDRIFDNQRNVMYSKWNHYVVTRNLCDELYMDDRFPLPDTVVIDPLGFKGWSSAASRALGDRVKLEKPDSLRETVRTLLQRGGSATHLCADYVGMEWAFSNSNQYADDNPGGMASKVIDPVAMAKRLASA